MANSYDVIGTSYKIMGRNHRGDVSISLCSTRHDAVLEELVGGRMLDPQRHPDRRP